MAGVRSVNLPSWSFSVSRKIDAVSRSEQFGRRENVLLGRHFHFRIDQAAPSVVDDNSWTSTISCACSTVS